MRKLSTRVWAVGLVPAVAAVTLIGAGVAYAFDSGDNPGGQGPNTVTWTGQGATDGVLKTSQCGEADDPYGANAPYLHWIFTTDGGSITEDPPVLTVEGVEYPESPPSDNSAGNAHHFVTPYFTPNGDLTASAAFNVSSEGKGAWNLVISHGCAGSPPDPKAALHIYKYYDANANGVRDGNEAFITGWQVTYNSVPTVTPFDNDSMPPGDYTVSEGTPNQTNWIHTTPTSASFTLADGDDKTVEFGNVCLGAGGGLTLGFWSNKNGQALVNGDDLALLAGLNLRNANGSNFDPATKLALKNWLLAGTAVNMANMLSVQLAAMELNVLNGFVSGGALIYAPALGGFVTINAVMTAANAELGLHGSTLAGSPDRAHQEALKNALDAANNNQNFVQATACSFSFAA